MKENFEKQINDELASLGADSPLYRSRIYIGNVIDRAVEYIKTNFPYGTVAAVYSKNSFVDYAKDFGKRIKELGINVVNVIAGEKNIYSVTNVYDLICTPEEVRAFIVFDYEKLDLAKYAATLRGASVIYLGLSGKFENVFAASVRIIEGNENCEAKIDCPVAVFLPEKPHCVSDLYAETVLAYSAIVDYEINALLTQKKEHIKALDMLKEAVNSAYGVFAYKEEERSEILFCAAIKKEVANALSDGELFNLSSVNAMLTAHKTLFSFHCKTAKKIEYAFKISRLYSCAFSEESDDLLSYPDYYKDCENMFRKTAIPFGAALTKILSHKRAYDGLTLSEKEKLKKIRELIPNADELEENVYQTFYKLGGKKSQEIDKFNQCIQIADLFAEENGLTVLREKGILAALEK